MPLNTDLVQSVIGSHFPAAREKSGAGATEGIPVFVSVPLGPPLLVDGVTYKQALFVAPCNGCYIKEGWLTGAVAIAGGTNTFAVDNYDASGNAARNVLSTTNIDPTTITAKEGLQLTLTTTLANRLMDEGDVLNVTLVCGTMTTDGEGYAVTFVIYVPDPL